MEEGSRGLSVVMCNEEDYLSFLALKICKKGHGPRNAEAPKAGKGENMDFSQEPPERKTVLMTP